MICRGVEDVNVISLTKKCLRIYPFWAKLQDDESRENKLATLAEPSDMRGNHCFTFLSLHYTTYISLCLVRGYQREKWRYWIESSRIRLTKFWR